MKTSLICLKSSLLFLAIMICCCSGPLYPDESGYYLNRSGIALPDSSWQIFTHAFRDQNLEDRDIYRMEFYVSNDILLELSNEPEKRFIIPKHTKGRVLRVREKEIMLNLGDFDIWFEKHRTASFSTGLEYKLATQIDPDQLRDVHKDGDSYKIVSSNIEDIRLLF